MVLGQLRARDPALWSTNALPNALPILSRGFSKGRRKGVARRRGGEPERPSPSGWACGPYDQLTLRALAADNMLIVGMIDVPCMYSSSRYCPGVFWYDVHRGVCQWNVYCSAFCSSV